MRIGVIGNQRYRALDRVLERLLRYAETNDVRLASETDMLDHWPETVPALDAAHDDLDLVVTFGGDGTLLRAVRALGAREVPLLSINLGHIGFLTSTTADELEQSLDAFRAGQHRIERRFTLSGAVVDPSGTPKRREPAVNDVVVHKTDAVRIIRLRVAVDGEPVSTYSADGIIVSSPAGSTAYSLSAGGPVLLPDVDAMVVTAICPHTLRVRPIVIPGSSVVSVELGARGGDGAHISFDGQLSDILERDQRVVVQRGDVAVLLVRLGAEGFFTRMQRKLEWGDLSDRDLAFRAD